MTAARLVALVVMFLGGWQAGKFIGWCICALWDAFVGWVIERAEQ